HYLSVQINDQYPFSHCFNEFVLGYRQHIKQIKLEQADGDKGIGDNKCKRCRIDRAERLKTTQQIKNIDQPGQSGNDDQEEGMLFINGFGPFETGNQQVVAQQHRKIKIDGVNQKPGSFLNSKVGKGIAGFLQAPRKM